MILYILFPNFLAINKDAAELRLCIVLINAFFFYYKIVGSIPLVISYFLIKEIQSVKFFRSCQIFLFYLYFFYLTRYC